MLLAAPFLLAALGCDKKPDSGAAPAKTDPTAAPDDSAKKKEKKDKKSKSSDDDDDQTQAKKQPKSAKSSDDDDDDTGDDDDEPAGKPKKKDAPADDTAALPDKKALSASIKSFFAAYQDGAKFDFYDDFFAPTVDTFISLKSTTPAAMAKDARAFYTGKTGLHYAPQLATLVVTPAASGDRETARLEVTMAWSYPPPKLWGTLDGQLVNHLHTATVEIVVGADGNWTAYTEPVLKRDSYKVVAPDGTMGAWATPANVSDGGAPELTLTKGTIVQDAFETLVVDMNPKGEVVARKIRQGGKDWWAMDHSAIAVENPNGGTSAGEDIYLEKLGN